MLCSGHLKTCVCIAFQLQYTLSPAVRCLARPASVVFDPMENRTAGNCRHQARCTVRTSLAEPKHEHVLRACPGRDFPVDHGVHILLTPHGSLHARTQTYGKSKDEAAQGRREATGRFWLTEVMGASWMSNHEGMRMPPANFIPYGIAVRVSRLAAAAARSKRA